MKPVRKNGLGISISFPEEALCLVVSGFGTPRLLGDYLKSRFFHRQIQLPSFETFLYSYFFLVASLQVDRRLSDERGEAKEMSCDY